MRTSVRDFVTLCTVSLVLMSPHLKCHITIFFKFTKVKFKFTLFNDVSENLKQCRSQLTNKTVERAGQIVGQVSDSLDSVFLGQVKAA